MKFRIKQNSFCDIIDPSYTEVVVDLTYSEITDILDIIPNDKIKEISLTIEKPEVFNGKKD